MSLDRYAAVHASEPQGLGDGRPTAQQVLDDQHFSPEEWRDKVILITGGTAGLGAESTRVLHQTGAKIFITGRDLAKGQRLSEELSACNPEHPVVEVITMDHMSLRSVRDGCAEFLQRSGGKLNVLLANAGIVMSKSPKTDDGFEGLFGINYLAVFLTVQMLAPALVESSTPSFKSRLAVVSSAGHRAGGMNPDDYNFTGPDGYSQPKAYAQSKTATILMANEFDRRYKGRGVRATSLNPGIIMDTEISRDLPGTSASRRPTYYKMEPLLAKYEKNVQQGAATQVWAAVAKELENVGGVYLDDVQIAVEAKFQGDLCKPGWKPWIWDEEMAGRLWNDSLRMCNLPSEADSSLSSVVSPEWKTLDLRWNAGMQPVAVDTIMYPTRESQQEQNMIARMWVLCAMEMQEKVKKATCAKPHFEKYRRWLLLENERFKQPNYPQVPEASQYVDMNSEERLRKMTDMREQVKDTHLWPVIEGPWRVYDNVVDIMEGHTKLVKILLKDGLLEKFYDWANGLSEIRPLFSLLGEAAGSDGLRVVEVGAGTGGTTARILDALQSKPADGGKSKYSEYVFTDISPLFFDAAKERFKDCHDMDYRELDITKSPKDQGFKEGSYDVVVASNVLHATPCLVDTLKNCRALLKPGGILFNQELSPPGKYVDFMVGLLPGWWLGEADGRADGPTVPPREWDRRLRQAGFEGLEAVGLDSEPPFYYNANMVAKASRVDIQGE